MFGLTASCSGRSSECLLSTLTTTEGASLCGPCVGVVCPESLVSNKVSRLVFK